mgnify:CR=1 FL=1
MLEWKKERKKETKKERYNQEKDRGRYGADATAGKDTNSRSEKRMIGINK